MKIIISTFLFIIICSGAIAAPTNADLDAFFRNKTSITNPLELRDPFKSPAIKTLRRESTGGKYHISGKGEFTNIGDSSLKDLNIQDIKVSGVMIGRERRAMIQSQGPGNSNNKKLIVVKEGTKIGPDNAEVKAILPGGIVLVEKITNVYGQEEYLETVIPISR